jgi:hypothetical protein
MFSYATLSDINVVLCYVLSQYHYKIELLFSGLVCTMHAFQNGRTVTSPDNTYCTEVRRLRESGQGLYNIWTSQTGYKSVISRVGDDFFYTLETVDFFRVSLVRVTWSTRAAVIQNIEA